MSERGSRIEAARRRTDVAKQVLAVSAVGLFGAVFLLVRSGHTSSAGSQLSQQPAVQAGESEDDGFLSGDGGSIAQAPSTQSFPQARTGMS
jgi:hypothetical protein